MKHAAHSLKALGGMAILASSRWRRAQKSWFAFLALALALALALSMASPGAVAAVGQGDAFLEPEQAFGLQARAVDAQTLELVFDVAAGHYLYREKFAAELAGADLPLQLPPGQVKFDTTFQKEVETYRDRVVVVARLPAAGTAARELVLTLQGCADRGLCYPPQQRVLRLQDGANGATTVAVLDPDAAARWLEARDATQPVASAAAAANPAPITAPIAAPITAPIAAPITAPATAASTQPATASSDPFASALQSRGLLQVIGVFLLAGVLLSFTPCVLPMVPILSSIIVGQSGTVSRARGFSLALAYSLGMALVYTAFGMLAGLMGEGLAASLQNAWVLGAFALLLVALSLSMFGVYELQMPSAVQSRITQMSGGLQGGRLTGVFVMGGLSALIVGPCVAAPLAGALVYISQTRDVVLGGAALFALATGMSLPLLLVGLSAGSLLPRAGAWMERVKQFFGFMLLAVAIWMVSPVIPPWLFMGLAAALLLSLAVLLGAFERLPEPLPLGRAASKGLGLTLAVLATLVLAGVASGGRELLQPLAHWGERAAPSVAAGGAAPAQASGDRPHLAFEPVSSADALRVIAASKRPVMLDVYADWCVACKEFEAITLRDPAVREALAGYTLLRVDVTANSPHDKQLMRAHSLFGPPAMLFFGPDGRASEAGRVIGFQGPKDFRASLARLGSNS